MTEQEAKEYLQDCIEENGDLYDLGWYVHYHKGNYSATLDGEFSPEALEAIAAYMRANGADD